MKLKKKLTGLGSLALATALFLSPAYAHDKIVKTSSEYSGIEYRIDKIENTPIHFFANPKEKTGQELLISTNINISKFRDDWKVICGGIYEDGNLIKLEYPDSYSDYDKTHFDFNLVIKHEVPGKHSYFVEFLLTNGKERIIRKSESKTLEFTGDILDVPPEYSKIWVNQYINNEWVNPRLMIDVYDYGDNKGITNIKVFEDGNLLKEFNKPSGFQPVDHENTSFWEEIELDLEKTGKHQYFAEIIDKGENMVRTKTIIINYD
ncbi:MAG: hypothetical protein KKA79_01570 [Nanoarchaeota archaeon]|nr:hypothetical protein [Nanoarchaeota archaeon]